MPKELAICLSLLPWARALITSSSLSVRGGISRELPEVLPPSNFPTLWRAFYDVMAAGPQTAPHATQPTDPGEHMFPNTTRNPSPDSPPLTNFEQAQLRAAIAAVNAIDARDADNVVTSRNVPIVGAGGAVTRHVM